MFQEENVLARNHLAGKTTVSALEQEYLADYSVSVLTVITVSLTLTIMEWEILECR